MKNNAQRLVPLIGTACHAASAEMESTGAAVLWFERMLSARRFLGMR